jgi:hypothetical protein
MCARANSVMVSMRPQYDEITQQILYKEIFRDLAELPRFLLGLAERWITPHVPAAAESAECLYSGASRVRARAFYLVAGDEKLPVRVQNIRSVIAPAL